MAHIQATDELVREYLLWRGFAGASKVLDTELRTADRERGFRVDKIIDQLQSYVHASELAPLRDYWQHLDSLLFGKLEIHFQPAVRKMEYGLYKLYLVVAASNGRSDKVTEFLRSMQPELQAQAEWREWFSMYHHLLPYVTKPEDSPMFSLYWSRGWQDALLVSLHNLLATVCQCMPAATLAAYESDAALAARLRSHNHTLQAALATASASGANERPTPTGAHHSRLSQYSERLNGPLPLVDDFYLLYSESPGDSGVREARGIRSLIRQMGSSPVQARQAKSSRSLSQN